MISQRPAALVITSLDAPGFPPFFVELADKFTANTRQALEEAGARPVVLNVNDRPLSPIADVLDGIDALVFLGGGDVDPALYGGPTDAPNLYGADRPADDYGIAVVREVLHRRLPLLAVCRGAQLLNVALGGTLIPDLTDWKLHRGPTSETVFVEEKVRLAPDSRLAGILGEQQPAVWNGHHQAVDRLGTGLRCVVRAEDGVIEAIEHTDHWAVGVQWHPEHPNADRDARRRVFSALVSEAKRAAAARGTQPVTASPASAPRPSGTEDAPTPQRRTA